MVMLRHQLSEKEILGRDIREDKEGRLSAEYCEMHLLVGGGEEKS